MCLLADIRYLHLCEHHAVPMLVDLHYFVFIGVTALKAECTLGARTTSQHLLWKDARFFRCRCFLGRRDG